jgi:hypothetical protein
LGGEPKRILLEPVARRALRDPLHPTTVSAVQKLVEKRRYYDKEISRLVKALSSDPLARKGFGLDPVSKCSVSIIRGKMRVKPVSRKRRSGVKIDPVTRRMAKNLVWSGRYSLNELVKIMEKLGRPVSLSTIRLMRREKARDSAERTKATGKLFWRESDVLHILLKEASAAKRLEALENLASVRSETIEALIRTGSRQAKAIYTKHLADIDLVLNALSSFLSKEVFAANGVDVKSL